jgi:hypothetical protein
LYYSTSHQQWLGTPLIHWTRDDIDTYLRRNGIEVQTTGRSGCVTCAFGAHLAADAGDENNLQKLHQSNPKMWLQALDGWGYRPALDTIHVAYRHVGPHGTQNTLSSEHALSPQVPMQDLPVEWHPTAFEAHLSAIPRDLFADHLDRLARRDRGWEGLDVGAWTDVPSLAKLVEIPTRVLAERLQGDASGTWERRRTEVGGVGLLEVRALDAERACDHLDQWCVAHDRDHRAAILDAVVDLRPRPADHPRQEIHSFSA